MNSRYLDPTNDVAFKKIFAEKDLIMHFLNTVLKLDEENKIVALRKVINDGIESARAVDFDAKKYLDVLKARRKSNG